ncbi:MAG: hypothetical protein FJX64_11925 [Alphaproteobacteria bacterium]|nr:hypothetical protein [Alphaproteobacteria bacterium]
MLGQAGPTALRTGSYLPATAMMQFDSADAAGFNSQGLLDEIVTHEMLYAIGIGSIWSYKGLVSGASFIGANATAAYDDLVDAFNGFENGVEALPVPVCLHSPPHGPGQRSSSCDLPLHFSSTRS